MRKGIIVDVTAADRVRLDAVVANRNSPQKHVWRVRIILLTADGRHYRRAGLLRIGQRTLCIEGSR